MMPNRIRVFVSSRMEELEPERLLVKMAMSGLPIDAWVFEKDAGARPESVVSVYLEEVEQADVYIGIFWRGYGEHTIKEYEHARKLRKDCLIYLKSVQSDDLRDVKLADFIKTVEEPYHGVSVKWYNTPEEFGESLRNDLLNLSTRAYHELKKSAGTRIAIPATPNERSLLRLGENVRRFWVEGVLESSLHSDATLDLDTVTQPDAIEQPWQHIVELPDAQATPIPAEKSIVEVFDDLGGSLLIMGAPGSGKTISMLRLCRDLLDRSGADPKYPVATIFNLSTWQGEPMEAWLVSELTDKYHVGKQCATWLSEGRLIPLLDGLDEVAEGRRSHCVKAVNALIESGVLFGLVVSCRLDEYRALPLRLKMNGAMRIEPLTLLQADSYLEQFGPSLDGVRRSLENDDDLRELASTPLMLDVMRLAYRDMSPEELASVNPADGAGARRHLLDTYVERLLDRGQTAKSARNRANTMRWLRWLARGMQKHQLAMFMSHYLSPTWLLNPRYWRACGVAACAVGGLGLGYAGWRLYGPTQGVILAMFAVLITFIAYVAAPVNIKKLIESQQSLQTFKDGFSGFENLAVISILVLSIGVGTGLGSAVFFWKFGLKAGLIFWGLQLIYLAILFWLVVRLPQWAIFVEPAIKAPTWGITTWIFPGLFFSESTAQVMGIAMAYYAGVSLVVFPVFRLGLIVLGRVPIRYKRFLDRAVQQAFLKKVGSAYIFRHRLLLEHLAETR